MSVRIIACLFVLLAFVAASPDSRGQARTQALPAVSIAVLDYQSVLKDAKAAQAIRQQIDGYRERYQDEIEQEERTLRQEEQELKRQRTLLTPEAFDERRQAFERRVIEVQRLAQDRTRSLDRSMNEAMSMLQATVIEIMEELSRKTGVNLVVDKSAVMVAATALDITDQVIEQLDRRLPTVEVPKPGG